MESESGLELSKASWPNIWKFLQPVSFEEVQKSRFMASLSHVSYCLSKITNPHFFRRYGLQFVTSSLNCKQPAKTAERLDDVLKTSDGMAVAKSEIPTCQEPAKVESSIELSNIVSVSADLQKSLNATQDDNSETENWNFGSLSNSIYSQSLAQFAKQVSLAASVSQSAVSVTLTRVMSLLQSTLGSTPTPSSAQSLQDAVPTEQDQGPKQGVVGEESPPVLGKCPTEWFVCDDVEKETRIFCIQGSDNFESWRTNLQFDPVVFEDEKLGVKVHRGIYKAAQSLYGLFVPLIKDHLRNGRGKKISFTGHSLGGAISTVMMMILVHRGVLEPQNVGQVFTFGGAACFCDNCNCSSCIFDPTDPQSSANQKQLLSKLQLPSSTVINIIMHKDITPRAFSSDYSPVAEFLRNWSSSFRTHGCLSSPNRSLLYNFIGEILVLQPDAGVGFVRNEGYHPMLPEEAGLFRLVDPDQGSLNLAEKLRKEWKTRGEHTGKEVDDKEKAFLALMDNPHPLDILSDTRAYGVMGAISRYVYFKWFSFLSGF